MPEPAAQPAQRPTSSSRRLPERIDSDAFVDEVRCVECHEEISAEYAMHPMGNSLGPVAEVERIEKVDADARATFTSGPFQYEVTFDGSKLIHKQSTSSDGKTVVSLEHDVAISVGSGQKGRSYLVNHGGYLTMSPLSWYATKQIWDLSPGYEQNDLGFHRPVLADCLFCHANRAHLVPQTKNKYASPMFTGHAIGCQRCHGPGRAHVEHQSGKRPTNGYDDTIVNPARLKPHLREAVCQQCHLAGAARVNPRGKGPDDFRPGMPLESAIVTYALRPSPHDEAVDSFVGQVEQMYASRCFEASDGELGCISCHDPHAKPAPETKASYYRNRCFACHRSNSCSLPEADRADANGMDNCVACHMPPLTTEVRHAATTNHRIPRHAVALARSPVGSTRGKLPLVEFPNRSLKVDQTEWGRDMAIALLQTALYHPRRVSIAHFQQVLTPLKLAVNRHPQDDDAREALGGIWMRLGKRELALEQFEQVLQRLPRREHSLVMKAKLQSLLGRYDEAVTTWESAVALNPSLPSYLIQLGLNQAKLGRWSAARDTAERGQHLFPTTPEFHQLAVNSHLSLGEKSAAEAALRVLLALRPREQNELRKWFAEHPGNRQ